MLDRDFKVYLIEANTNPWLELPWPLLARVISGMLDNSFRIALDPLFPPNDLSFFWKRTAALPAETKYQLVFDETIDAEQLDPILKQNTNPCLFDIEEEEVASENDESEENDQDLQDLKLSDDIETDFS